MKYTKNVQVTLYLPVELKEALRKMSYLSRKSQSALVAEAIQLLMKTPAKGGD